MTRDGHGKEVVWGTIKDFQKLNTSEGEVEVAVIYISKNPVGHRIVTTLTSSVDKWIEEKKIWKRQ
jgi:hypothetical protein